MAGSNSQVQERKIRPEHVQGLDRRAREILTFIARNSKSLGLPHINSFRYGMDGLNVLRDRLITISTGTFPGSGTARLIVRCHEDKEPDGVFIAWQGNPPVVFGMSAWNEKIDGKLSDFEESERMFLHSNPDKAYSFACAYAKEQATRQKSHTLSIRQANASLCLRTAFSAGAGCTKALPSPPCW
ncbi:MAG: hypothetical protein WC717_03450 [Candidatus Micrarchaeia archaeon]|jgi:hypothetical protein